MLLKRVSRTATFAWSPGSLGGPAYIAAGSMAGSFDADFSASARLEIFAFSQDGDGSMPLTGAIDTPERFNRLDWAALPGTEFDAGLIAGGCVDGAIHVWNARTVLDSAQGDAARPLAVLAKHEGDVRAVQFCPSVPTMLASAGMDAQLYIWNLASSSASDLSASATVPGGRNPHTEEITDVAWNRKVGHILGTTSVNGMTVVWDLKQKRPVFNFADKTRKLRCSSLAWNPENATQLAVASDDDGLPVVQIWDLRTAVAPLRQLEGHTAGILSLAWCPDDANLLLSCGRDNRTLCWNPDDGRIVSELPSADNWVHRVQWSSRSPAVFASASFDGQVSVYSMQGSEAVAEEVSPHGLGSGYAPKWLRRPAGAQFAFGGKLVSHTWDATAKKSSVRVQTVVTEPEFVQQADQLSKATDWAAFAQQKASSAAAHGDATTEQRVWSLLAALVGGNARQQIVSLLQNDADRGVSSPSAVNGTEVSDSELFEKLTPPDTPSPASVQRAVVTGRFDQAVSQCISLGQWADALLFASCAGGDLWESTRSQYLASMQQTTYARITAAIVKGTFAELVEAVDDLAISWKDVLSTLTSFAPEADFCTLVERLAQRLEADGERDAAVMCYMCSGSMDKAITLWNGDKVEKALLLHQYGDVRGSGDAFYSLIIDYAQRLAAQGLLDLAARYMDLAPKNDAQAQLLRERILATIGQSASQVAPVTPPAPVSSQPAAVQQYQTAAPTTQSYVSHHPAPYQHQETAHQAQQFHLPHPDVQRVVPVASSTHGALNTGNAPIADGQNQQQPPHGRVATAYEQIAHSSTANTAQPVSATATATVAAPANSGGSPTATPTSSAHSVEDFDVNTWITGANKDTAAYLKDLFKFVYGEGADMRKKDFVGKSLLSLFAALASNKLSAPVSSQLDSMAQSLSTRNFAAATEAVAKMTADHWSESSNFVKGLKQFIIDAKPKL